MAGLSRVDGLRERRRSRRARRDGRDVSLLVVGSLFTAEQQVGRLGEALGLEADLAALHRVDGRRQAVPS